MSHSTDLIITLVSNLDIDDLAPMASSLIATNRTFGSAINGLRTSELQDRAFALYKPALPYMSKRRLPYFGEWIGVQRFISPEAYQEWLLREAVFNSRYYIQHRNSYGDRTVDDCDYPPPLHQQPSIDRDNDPDEMWYPGVNSSNVPELWNGDRCTLTEMAPVYSHPVEPWNGLVPNFMEKTVLHPELETNPLEQIDTEEVYFHGADLLEWRMYNLRTKTYRSASDEETTALRLDESDYCRRRAFTDLPANRRLSTALMFQPDVNWPYGRVSITPYTEIVRVNAYSRRGDLITVVLDPNAPRRVHVIDPNAIEPQTTQ